MIEFDRIPRAVAIDLDGTLLDSRSEISRRSRHALEACIARRVPVIIATSRPTRIFNRIFSHGLAQQCSYVLMSGALAIGNPPLSGYFKEALSEETLRSLIGCALAYDPHARITIEMDGYEFGVNYAIDPSVLWQRNSATPDMVITLDEAVRKNPCKVAIGSADIAGLATVLTEQFGDSLSIVGSKYTHPQSNPLLMVTSRNATKTEALRRLLDPNGISLAEVLAFGDDLPDVEMLKECGISVAVANALPEVRAICDYQTASNDEDGVALVLEQLLAIPGK